jgi:hypothetical protein
MAVSVSGIFFAFVVGIRARRKYDTNKNTNKSSDCRRLWQDTREQIQKHRLVFAEVSDVREHLRT